MKLHASFDIRHTFPVIFGRDFWHPDNPELNRFFQENPTRRILVLLERTVAEAFPGLESQITLKLPELGTPASSPVIRCDGGENAKTLDETLKLCACLENAALCRHSTVIAIGGGAFLDMVGLSASLTHRGVRLIRMPSTPLAQADSGVGVKNGVNAFGKKNFLGCFIPPCAVFSDFAFLDKLPHELWLSAVPEALKVSMIKDADFFNWIISRRDALAAHTRTVMEELITRSAVHHLNHITRNGDPFENGSARPLDFGHWAAHKLEALSVYRIGHAQAVAVGILIDSAIAEKRGLLKSADFANLVEFLGSLGFELTPPELFIRNKTGGPVIQDGLDEFREHLGGELQITLPDGLGSLLQTNHIDLPEIEYALTRIRPI